MNTPDPTITLLFGIDFDGGSVFTLNDPVRGILDNTLYLLGGDTGTNIAASAYDISIRRGRRNVLENTDVGTATVAFRNYDRQFDPLNTESPLHGSVGPGVETRISMYGERIFTGYTDDWLNSYTVSGEAIGSFPCIDGLGVMARQAFDAWTSTSGEKPGQRLTAILDRDEVGWPDGLRNIAPGVNTLVGDNITWGSDPANYVQLVAESDFGNAYIDRNGVFTFRDRAALVNPVPSLTFSDEFDFDLVDTDGAMLEVGGGTDVLGGSFDFVGLPFYDAPLTSASENLYSQVSIDREGGTVQTASSDGVGIRSAIRRLSKNGLLMDSDPQALDMANWLLSLLSEPIPHLASISVDVSAIPESYQARVARLDVGDVIRVVWTPLNVGSTLDETYSIEGVEHRIPFDASHTVTYSLSPVTQSTPFTLDDALLGLADGIGRLSF